MTRGRSEDACWKVESVAEHASSAAIAQLRSVAPVDLPESYFSLLSFGNGGEGPLPIQPLWLCLYPAEEATRIELEGTFQEFFAKLFVIAAKGGNEAVAFDLREGEPCPLVTFDMTNIKLSQSIWQIAPSFDDAMELIGRDDQ